MSSGKGELTGVVTSLESEFGFIDGNVFFTASVCQNQKLPKLNDHVTYTAKSREDLPLKKIATFVCCVPPHNVFNGNGRDVDLRDPSVVPPPPLAHSSVPHCQRTPLNVTSNGNAASTGHRNGAENGGGGSPRNFHQSSETNGADEDTPTPPPSPDGHDHQTNGVIGYVEVNGRHNQHQFSAGYVPTHSTEGYRRHSDPTSERYGDHPWTLPNHRSHYDRHPQSTTDNHKRPTNGAHPIIPPTECPMSTFENNIRISARDTLSYDRSRDNTVSHVQYNRSRDHIRHKSRDETIDQNNSRLFQEPIPSSGRQATAHATSVKLERITDDDGSDALSGRQNENRSRVPYEFHRTDRFTPTRSRDNRYIKSESQNDGTQKKVEVKLERRDGTPPPPRVKLERRSPSPNHRNGETRQNRKLSRCRDRSRSRSPDPAHNNRSAYRHDRNESRDRRPSGKNSSFDRNRKVRNRQNYTQKIIYGSIPRTPPTPLANRVVLSAPTRHYTSSSHSIPLRFAASSLNALQQQFRVLSSRHSVKIDHSWKPPNIVRRKRAQILAGQNPAVAAETGPEAAIDDIDELQIDEEDDVNFLIDEETGDAAEIQLNEARLEAALNEAETIPPSSSSSADQETTIGYQAIKELRKDFEKAGLLTERIGKRKKSILQEDYKKILNKAGELIKYIRAIKSHPDRIHPELWYNEEKMANDGPLCRCSADQRRGINHGVYPGEKNPPQLDSSSNNLDKLYHYRVAISPKTNFKFKDHLLTRIGLDGKVYTFGGFSLLSHRNLASIPDVPITRYHNDHRITLLPESPPSNFCLEDLDLFSDFFFKDTLELYDWLKGGGPVDPDLPAGKSQKFFYFLPRFERKTTENAQASNNIEVLGMDHVMAHFLAQDAALIDPKNLPNLLKCPEPEWEKYIDRFRGQLVTNPGKKPSTIRLDQLDREQTFTGKTNQNDRFPTIVHFGVRPANLSYAGDPVYQKVFRTYQKLRHLITNKPRIKQEHWQKIADLEVLLQKMRRMGDMQREVTTEISCENFRRTGIYPDMAQFAFILPVVTHHIRYYQCLDSLQETLGYKFKNIQWLTRAMTHPSAVYNYGENPDQVRNSLTNCGIRKPTYGAEGPTKPYERKRGIVTLIKVMALLGTNEPKESPINYLERPEFLGDAVLGFICSVSLFHLFPHLGEGALSMLRCALVSNVHLSVLAQKLQLDKYFVYVHAQDLARKEDLNNALANCFEAVLGAMYMDGGLEVTRRFLARCLFDDAELQNIWLQFPAHPLQAEFPDGDRHKIEGSKILQKCVEFENIIGVEFKHIRLLAKAFTQKNVKYNEITKGNNQRLEFLGDSICNFLSAEFLFKHFPLHHEGHLTLLRCTMVGAPTQALVAQQLGMEQYVISRQTLSHDKMGWKQKILADLMEAFIAALFIDRGIVFVDVFMKVCFYPRLKHFIMQQVWNDPKSCLQQCCLTLRPEEGSPDLPDYKVLQNSGSSQKLRYKVAVYFRNEQIGEGHGSSIQQAEKFAARKALEKYYFPQREWQEYYINTKAQYLQNGHKRKHPGDDTAAKADNPGHMTWNAKNKELPPEREVPKWSLGRSQFQSNQDWQPRIREGIWSSNYFKKLQENNRDDDKKVAKS